MIERNDIKEFCEPCDWSKQNGICSRSEIGAEGQAERATNGLCDGASQELVIGKMTANGFEPYTVYPTKAVEELTEPETGETEEYRRTISYTFPEEGKDGRMRTRQIKIPVTEEVFEIFRVLKAESEMRIAG